jgi:hypothetical protein
MELTKRQEISAFTLIFKTLHGHVFLEQYNDLVLLQNFVTNATCITTTP